MLEVLAVDMYSTQDGPGTTVVPAEEHPAVAAAAAKTQSWRYSGQPGCRGTAGGDVCTSGGAEGLASCRACGYGVTTAALRHIFTLIKLHSCSKLQLRDDTTVACFVVASRDRQPDRLGLQSLMMSDCTQPISPDSSCMEEQTTCKTSIRVILKACNVWATNTPRNHT
jgi:hypothetical protein